MIRSEDIATILSADKICYQHHKMNGLVSYDSSDEDEEDEPSSSTPAPLKSYSPRVERRSSTDIYGKYQKEKSAAGPEAHGELAPLQGPMVGPTLSTESTSTGYNNDNTEHLQSMPERDILRYLTQPSRPMTSLPPEPQEATDPEVTKKFKKFFDFKACGRHFNGDLATKTSFKNPGLFASLLDRGNLASSAQYGSTLPSSVFNPDSFPEWAYKENLLSSQQVISTEIGTMKKAQSAVGKRTIDFTSASRNGNGNHEPASRNTSKRRRD